MNGHGRCPIEGCNVETESRAVMCRAHWRYVPPALRKVIEMLWHGGKRRPGYEEACAAAIKQVNDDMRGAA